MKDYSEIKISDRHVVLRTVAFVLALLLAVGAIAFGVSQLSRKAPGWYDVEAAGDDETVLYGRAIRFRYRLQGSSPAINAELRSLQTVYSASLKRYAELLDPREHYHGVVNLASLNHSVGETLTVDPELFAVLTEALALTERGEGYSLFAGALYAEWNSILYLEDPQPFDPLENPDEAARLARLAELASRPGAFTLTVVDAETCALRLDADPAALAELEELELPGCILDLNLLRDAFLLRLVAEELARQGYTEGYLSAENGLSLALSDMAPITVRLLGLGEKGPMSAALLPLEAGRACCTVHAFPTESLYLGRYQLTDAAGRTVYRHPWLTAAGEWPGVLLSAAVLGAEPVAVCYDALRLLGCASPEAVAALAAELEAGAGWTLDGEAGLVHFNARAAALGMEADADYGWTPAT
ncbi:MAG: hypothetical protein IKS66_00055 [Oscillospiraceae bacterium]|nr:hypothetical protein [Oscillospiraceae bacterium]